MNGHAKDSTSLLDLMRRLSADVGRLIDQRLELFKVELKQEAAHTAKNLGLLAAGAVGASLGAMFLLVALGLWIGDAVGSKAGGLAIVGGGLVLVGGVLGLLAARGLQRRQFARHAADDLRRDAEWIRHKV